jgi:hypothetical protein
MALYDTFAQAASQLLAGELGGVFVLRRVSGGGYDDNGDAIPVTKSDKRVRGVVKDKKEWDKGTYLGSRLVAVLDNKIEPKPDDKLIVGKTTYTITDVKTVAPNGVTVLSYEAGLS